MLSAENVAAWRLRRHHLERRGPAGSALRVASDLCGLHAQVMSSAELTLWARVEGLRPGQLSDTLWEDRALAKTWAMRGTLHLLPSAEMPLWVAALSTRRRHLRPVWLKTFGFTREELEQVLGAVGQALEGRLLTREDLVKEVGDITGSPELGRKLAGSWGSALKPAAFRGLLCFGPNLGQNVRFTRPDRWLEDWREEDPAAALREVTRRFLATYGPATAADLGRWWGDDAGPAARMLRELGDEVAQVEVDGVRAWMLSAHVDEAGEAVMAGSVRLLPAFDQYVVGASRGNTSILPAAHKGRVYRPQGWLSPVLLVDGRMEGVWRHESKGDRLRVEIEPFGQLAARARAEAEAEAERLATFFGARLTLSWN